MNNKEKLRRLKVLMGNHYIMVRCFQSWKTIDIKSGNERSEIFKLASELNIPDNELLCMWVKLYDARRKLKDLQRVMPKRERKDNKHIHVGSNGGNKNKVRYPSKKRSRATWKRFYLLFPRLAEEDNWDGKTSDKMK
jgi:hypothetical protein